MHGDRRLGGWLRSSRRKQAEEREERIRANRQRVVGWAWVMENVVPVLAMIRVADPRPLENLYARPAPDASGRIRSYREAPFYYWRIAEASQWTTPPLPAIKALYARWVFTRNDRFALLTVMVESYELDSQVADALTFAAEAARMVGWREEDSRALHEWLREMVSADPSAEDTHAQARFGFTQIGFERRRRTGTTSTGLSLWPTAHSLGGRPLDAEGREVSSPNSGDE